MSGAGTPRIWRIPIVIAIVSTIALVVALLDDGVWDAVAALTMAATLVFAIYKGATENG